MSVSPEQLDQIAKDILAGLPPQPGPRDRLAIPPQEMACLDPKVRAASMSEVALGYTEAQARAEAARCLQCKNAPCVGNCPVGIDIPGFVGLVAKGEDEAALSRIKESNLLPAVCGRVCPQETQCQMNCTVGKSLGSADKAVAIGRLERFVADKARAKGEAALPEIAPATGKRVAVVGSGPASLTVAFDARRAGHEVTIFEAFHKLGGVMVYGIPEFRLPKALVAQEIGVLERMGVKIETNTLIGRTMSLADLKGREGFDAIFIGSGAGLPKFLDIPGELAVGVFAANEYLTRANLMRAWDRDKAATPLYPSKRVAVLGGGNVAMDAARMALRLGAEEVRVVYRRTRDEMPARSEEIAHAEEEGVVFDYLAAPVAIEANQSGAVSGLRLVSYTLGEPDSSGRRSPVRLKDSERLEPFDTVIVAVGNGPNPLLGRSSPELRLDAKGHVVVDERGETSIPGVYSGGDIVLGAGTVILAMGEGRKCAASINQDLAKGGSR
jgi:glutamate synthase (NADPH) small chain